MQYRRISADCHLDLPWLPPELFTSQAPRDFKDRMPFVEDGKDGPRWVTKAGVFMGIPGAVGSVGAPFVPGQNYRVDKMAETGLYEAGKRGERRPGDPHLRIKEMEKDGVDAEIIFGILGVASRLEDHEAANEMLRIYNDWLKDFCSHYPDRQIGLACLPYGDIEAAAKEVYRVAKLGLRGLRTLMLLGYGPDVAPVLGAAVEGRQRRATAAAFPHLPRHPAAGAQPAPGQHEAPGAVHQCRRVPDEPDPDHRRDHRRRGAGALPEPARRLWRERHRLAALRARPDGFRIRGPLPRPDEDEAERLLEAAVQGDVPVRPHRPKADRRDRSRNAHVGFGLSASRWRVA